MHIFSNGFPTNLPDSEHISQGGPANFERLFFQYMEEAGLSHRWTGVILEGVISNSVRLEHACETPQANYYRLCVPKQLLRAVLKAKNSTADPARLWSKPIARLERIMREQKPDVVFLNGYGVLNWMLLRAAKNAGIPVVVQHAGIWTKELRLHKDRYSEHGRRLLEDMEKESSQLASVEVFLNGWSRDYYRDNVAPGTSRKTEVIPLPFNFASFEKLSTNDQAAQFSFEKNKLHIGVIARWDSIKNHPAVLAIAKEARRQKLPWQFHSIVDIPDTEEYRSDKTAYKRYVDVIAPVDRAGVSNFCRSVDLLLLPSLFDVSPTVVLEAVALNTPIVISPTVGHARNFIAYGGGPWVIGPEDTKHAVRSIAAVLGKGMPAQLKEKILEAHDHRKVFAGYLQLFAEARLREMPMSEVVRKLFWQELSRVLPWFAAPAEEASAAA